mmetsp:Transcript_42806/g.118259  ORF Transcript_42806/g.118259 Transcript_42806/m.118259 type:complete len:202 (+) Transcript_42806:204-809(+)
MANNFVWKPRTIEESVDAGVHPAVAAMRLAQKATPEGSGRIVGGMDLKATPWLSRGYENGYTYNKRNGPASMTAVTHPTSQIDRLAAMGMNPQDYFKQSKATGLNPVQDVLTSKSGPGMPGREKKDKKDKKGKKKGKSKDKRSKDKKDKKKKTKKTGKPKKKKKKDSSTSSSSESSEKSSSSSSSASNSSDSEHDKKRRKK